MNVFDEVFDEVFTGKDSSRGRGALGRERTGRRRLARIAFAAAATTGRPDEQTILVPSNRPDPVWTMPLAADVIY